MLIGEKRPRIVLVVQRFLAWLPRRTDLQATLGFTKDELRREERVDNLLSDLRFLGGSCDGHLWLQRFPVHDQVLKAYGLVREGYHPIAVLI